MNNIVYLKDCMEGMKETPDKYYDLAIVDPPYGAGFTEGGGCKGWFAKYHQEQPLQSMHLTNGRRKKQKSYESFKQKQGEIKKKIISWDIAPSQEYFDELFRISQNQIIWGGNYFQLPPTRCFLVWRKKQISENFSMAMCEYAWTSFNSNAKVFEYSPMGTKEDPRFHPTQKPVALYAWILNNYAKKGDKILDTHVGSGSSRIACYDLGFDFTGYEIDQEYWEKQEKRFEAYTRQQRLNLFD